MKQGSAIAGAALFFLYNSSYTSSHLAKKIVPL